MNELRKDFHKQFCDSLHAIYLAKNKDYGNSFAKVRDEYPHTAIAIRLMDKLERIKVLLKNGERNEVKGESLDDSLIDLANYCLLELVERKVDNEKRCQEGTNAYTDSDIKGIIRRDGRSA